MIKPVERIQKVEIEKRKIYPYISKIKRKYEITESFEQVLNRIKGEQEMKYLVLKTSEERVATSGSLYEAIRGHWVLDPEHAKECDYVVAAINKKIQAIYKPDKWYKSTVLDDRYTFAGIEDKELTNIYIGKELPASLCLKAAENPVRYCEELEV